MEFTRRRPTVPRLRGLPATRHGALALALVCAVAAAGIILMAIGHYRSSAVSAGKQVSVLVAASTIEKGTSGETIASQKLFKTMAVLSKDVASGSVTDTTVLQGKVASQNILPGQQLTVGDFAVRSGYIGQLAPTQRAMSIPLDTSHGMASVVQAGDHVDVYAGLDVNGSQSTQGSGGATVTGSASASVGMRLLMADVPVLAVNLNGGGGVSSNGVQMESNVLLKVPATQAGALAFASDNGKVWVVLRGANAVTPKSKAGVLYTVNSVLHGNGGQR